jgi:hypothetical protein
MRPTIIPPAAVRVVARDRPRIGEVWAFVSAEGRIIVHRCTGRTSGGYVFQGDGRAAADPATPPELVIGRAVTVRDRHGERSLGVLDRLRGVVRHAARRTGRATRWVVSLISRRGRSG